MVVSGIRSGLVSQVLGIAGIAAGAIFAYHYGEKVGAMLNINPEYAVVAGFAIIFIAAVVLATLLAHLLSKVISFIGLSWVNRLLGAAFAVIKGIVVLGLLYTTIYAINDNLKIVDKEVFDNSIAFNQIRNVTQPLLNHWDSFKEAALEKTRP